MSRTTQKCERAKPKARKFRYAVAESVASTAALFEFVVDEDGGRVFEVHSGEFPREEVVFEAYDKGSAHAVALALSQYWSSVVSPNHSPSGQQQERYSVYFPRQTALQGSPVAGCSYLRVL